MEGSGPVTLSSDLCYLKLVLTHAAAVHGVDVKVEPVDLARVALKRLGLISKSRQRDRRPTPDEIRRLLDHFDHPLSGHPDGPHRALRARQRDAPGGDQPYPLERRRCGATDRARS